MRWLYFGLAAVAVGAVLVLLNDLRVQMKAAAGTVNEKLPRILEKTEKTAETLAMLSAEGLPQGAGHDRTIVRYADRVLDAVEASGGVVGTKALVGGGGELKDPQPAAEWARGARKEALWQTLRVKSKDELLERLGETKFGTAWHIQVGGGPPMKLAEWARERVKEEE